MKQFQIQIRAWENSVVTAMANYATGPGNGRSCVYAANGDELLLGAEGVEEVYVVDIDLDQLRQTRANSGAMPGEERICMPPS